MRACKSSRYRPADDLPRLIGIWPKESDGLGGVSRREIIARLETALRAERRRGIAGHWTYDLQRHAMLSAALAAERRLLDLEAGPTQCRTKQNGGAAKAVPPFPV